LNILDMLDSLKDRDYRLFVVFDHLDTLFKSQPHFLEDIIFQLREIGRRANDGQIFAVHVANSCLFEYVALGLDQFPSPNRRTVPALYENIHQYRDVAFFTPLKNTSALSIFISDVQKTEQQSSLDWKDEDNLNLAFIMTRGRQDKVLKLLQVREKKILIEKLQNNITQLVTKLWNLQTQKPTRSIFSSLLGKFSHPEPPPHGYYPFLQPDSNLPCVPLKQLLNLNQKELVDLDLDRYILESKEWTRIIDRWHCHKLVNSGLLYFDFMRRRLSFPSHAALIAAAWIQASDGAKDDLVEPQPVLKPQFYLPAPVPVKTLETRSQSKIRRKQREEAQWTGVYPKWMDSTKSTKQGRRIPVSLAVDSPTVDEIFAACQKLDCPAQIEPYPDRTISHNRPVQILRVRMKVERSKIKPFLSKLSALIPEIRKQAETEVPSEPPTLQESESAREKLKRFNSSQNKPVWISPLYSFFEKKWTATITQQNSTN